MTSGRGDEAVEVSADRASLEARAVRIDAESIDPCHVGGDHPRISWCQPNGDVISSSGAVDAIHATGPDRFRKVRAWARTAGQRLAFDGPTTARPRFLGGFSFDDDAASVEPWTAFPAAWFVIPARQLVFTDAGTWLTVITEGDSPTPAAVAERLTTGNTTGHREEASVPNLTNQRPVPHRDRWLEQVAEIQREIGAGRLRKAVLGHTTDAALASPTSAGAVAQALRARHPTCYRFVFSPRPEHLFVGASPERLIEGEGRQLQTDALAGSRRRGDTPETDEALERELEESPKDAFEHEVVVDAIRDRLAASCADITTGERSIRKLASVQHLHTPIEATRPEGRHLLDVVESLHPTPAVGGLPREVALTTLQEVEDFDRGWYAAPVGWFDRAGNGQFALGIRSAVLSGTETTLFAGAGIVAESDPTEEWAELQLKYQPIRATFGER